MTETKMIATRVKAKGIGKAVNVKVAQRSARALQPKRGRRRAGQTKVR